MKDIRNKILTVLVQEFNWDTIVFHRQRDNSFQLAQTYHSAADKLTALYVGEWVRVENRLPVEKGYYCTIFLGRVFPQEWDGVYPWLSNTTHWFDMKFPELPTQ